MQYCNFVYLIEHICKILLALQSLGMMNWLGSHQMMKYFFFTVKYPSAVH